jgi:hypothetical protein
VKPEKLQSVLGLAPDERYAYFIRKVADATTVWSLENNGWAMAADDAGGKLAPFWPEEEFAAACAAGAWDGYSPKGIELEAFVGKWLPGLERDGLKVAIFPTPSDKGVIREPEDVRSDLLEEVSQYE